MPGPDDILAVARAKIGLGEIPPGSNHNLVTDWYGAQGPWCAMFVSWVLAHGGFSDDGGTTLKMNGIAKTTQKGWAYVPFLLNNFRDASLTTMTPEAGMIVIYDWDGDRVPDHTGIVESVIDATTIAAIEGNYHDQVQRVRRDLRVVEAFCVVPYDASPIKPSTIPQSAAGVPPFLGYCSLGSQGVVTRAVQQRLSDRSWHIQVDGIFGTETLRIVKQFQQDKGLVVDGVVGPDTWNALWTTAIT